MGTSPKSAKFFWPMTVNSPPENILNALSRMGVEHKRKGHQIRQTIDGMLEKNPQLRMGHARPVGALDRLYESSYLHEDEECDCQQLYVKDAEDIHPSPVPRKERDSQKDDPAIHYGLIASANTLMKDALTRDALVQKHNVLCFEMEAAGLVNHFPCVVIRGMCDYADSHKNDIWHGYAAATAAAYAKELLSFIPSAIPVDGSTKYHVQFSLEGLPCVKKFISRPVEMEPLKKALLPTSSDARRKVFVIRGIVGIGKTQIAIEFMRNHHTEFTAIFGLDGSSEDAVKQSLAKHSRKILFGQHSTNSKVYARGDEEGISIVVKKMLNWFAKLDNTRWLMVFDNVDREHKSIDPLAYDIKKYFPNSDHGSILITTRLTRMEQLGDFHEVKKVNNETAQAILESRYQVSCGKLNTCFQIPCCGTNDIYR